MLLKFQLFIGGEWVDSESGETYSRVNPADPDESLGPFQKGNLQDAAAAVDAAQDASQGWADMPPPKRGQYLLKAAELLQTQKEQLATTMTREMGKPLRESLMDIQQAINLAYYTAAEGRRLLGHTSTSEKPERFVFTFRMPIGVVALISPWNFPMMIPARKIFYSLICGNTVVFKPSSEAPQCATQLVEILQQTGLPKGVLNLVTGPGEVVGDALAKNRQVILVSFCGHKDTGAKILATAGVKRVSLELGGKNALIILSDADLNRAVEAVLWGGFATSGQRCTATSRVIVEESVREKVEKMLNDQISRIRLGNGLDPKTDMGPLVNKKAQDKTLRYCKIGVGEGAKLLAGGHVPEHLRGWFFEPTIFGECKADMQLCREEIFGPVVSVLSAKSLDDAIDITNSSDYGLSSAVYTKNIGHALLVVKRLQTGITYVNNPTVGSEVHLPFGGVKASGSNREGGPEGVNEFTELKTVYINYSTNGSSICSRFGNPSYSPP